MMPVRPRHCIGQLQRALSIPLAFSPGRWAPRPGARRRLSARATFQDLGGGAGGVRGVVRDAL